MIVKITTTVDSAEITLSQEIRHEEAIELREQLNSMINRGIIFINIDMTLVGYIDSGSLCVLVNAQKKVSLKNGKITVSGIQGLVKEIFILTRLFKIF